MNSQKTHKNKIYPADFTEEDKTNYDILFEQSKILFPHLAGDDWLLRMGILAYMRKEKSGSQEPPTDEEINSIKQNYSQESVYYTEPDECPIINEKANLILVE